MVVKMENEDEMIIENIDEFVNDEARIVTYKYISLTLSVNMTKAKFLLEEYLKTRTENEFDVVYFIGGVKRSGDSKILSYSLVRKTKLEDMKKKFVTVNTCHIYSIQKSKLKDANLLYTTDYDVVKQSLHNIHELSGIQCAFTRRTALKTSNQEITKSKSDQNGHSAPEIKEEVKKPIPKPETNKKPETGKETSTAMFFGTKNNAKKVSTKPSSESETKKPPEKKESSNALASAFAKSKPKKTEEEKKESAKAPKEKEPTNETETVEEEKESKSKETNMEVDEPSRKPSKQKTNKSEKQPEKSFEKISKSEKSKKRKATIQESDDEDDDAFNAFLAQTKKKDATENKSKTKKKNETKEQEENEDVDVVAPTPEPVKKPKNKRRKKESEKPATPPHDNKMDKEETKKDSKEGAEDNASTKVDDSEEKPPTKRRGKRKVLKTKQYINDDGFMVTKKEYEDESFSEDSDNDNSAKEHTEISPERKREIATKKTEKALENQSKAHSKKAKTQSSLTSFFKRK